MSANIAAPVERQTVHVDMAGLRLTGLPTPVDAMDAVPKSYADAPAYTPAAPSDWPVAPTTVAGALDALAARVQALEDAP